VITFDGADDELGKTALESASAIDELTGSLASNPEEERLMRSVLENDRDTIEDGKLITDAVNAGLGSFVPDLLFASLTKNYKNAQQLMGDSIIRELTGYEPGFVEKNVAIPEFRRDLQKRLQAKVDRLTKQGLLDKQGHLTAKGYFLSSLILYTEELEHLLPRGLGERVSHRESRDGDKKDYAPFKGKRYRDLAVRQTLKVTLRRGHDAIQRDDLRAFTREQKGKISVIYAMDASGSMKGAKLRTSKRAGIALAYKAIADRNDVGLVVFGSQIEQAIPPCRDFPLLLEELAKVRASMETDIALAITTAVQLFASTRQAKHLLLLTDALPTRGKKPDEDTLRAASAARDADVTVSLVGISLEPKGLELAKRVAEIGRGRLYIVKDLENLDKILLEDYQYVAH